MLKLKVVLAFICCSLFSLSSQTRLNTDFKEYTFEVFPLHNIKKLDIRAKHAQINMLNWDKDSISIETNIEIISDKPNLSKEMLKEVTIKKVAYSNTLQVKTSFIREFNRTIPYKISYNIFFPKKLALQIENNHGSVHIGEVEGGVSADVSYCDVNFKNLEQKNDSIHNKLILLHCNGKINHMGSATVKIENSNLDILQANKITANTAYSLLNFKSTKNYIGESVVDNVKFDLIDNISIKSENSIIKIGQFNSKGHFECKKGNLTIGNSTQNFTNLTINNFQSSTEVRLNPNSSYTINGEVINGVFTHPQASSIQIVKDLENISISGEVGADPSSKAKVIIFNRNEKIEFK